MVLFCVIEFEMFVQNQVEIAIQQAVVLQRLEAMELDELFMSESKECQGLILNSNKMCSYFSKWP